jgi:organic hydroperoxide reductase OsmC/OhrA
VAEKKVFESRVIWSEGRKGLLRISDGPEIDISTPPQFGGDKGYWSPEEMFLASINSCTMTTFLYFVDRFRASFISYESDVMGEVDLVGGKFMFTAISIHPRVVVADESKKEKVQLALDKSEKYCLISNSTKTEIKVHPEIVVSAG